MLIQSSNKSMNEKLLLLKLLLKPLLNSSMHQFNYSKYQMFKRRKATQVGNSAW